MTYFTKEEAMRIFDVYAPSYDRAGAHHYPDIKLVVELASLQPGTTLLDLGCGTGTLLLLASKAMGHGKVVGVDISMGMLRMAFQKLEEKPEFKGNIFLPQADITNPQDLRNIAAEATRRGYTTSQKFDVITSLWTFGHLPPAHQVPTLREWKNLLKPGSGRMVVEWNSEDIGSLETFDFKADRPGSKWILVHERHWAACERQFRRIVEQAGMAVVSMQRTCPQVGDAWTDQTPHLDKWADIAWEKEKNKEGLVRVQWREEFLKKKRAEFVQLQSDILKPQSIGVETRYTSMVAVLRAA
jgi:ubiquinone/menaquinone biosynthesis C-methylase UbiE